MDMGRQSAFDDEEGMKVEARKGGASSGAAARSLKEDASDVYLLKVMDMGRQSAFGDEEGMKVGARKGGASSGAAARSLKEDASDVYLLKVMDMGRQSAFDVKWDGLGVTPSGAARMTVGTFCFLSLAIQLGLFHF
eukprot:TRINITY_DN13879_c0_g1_i9.p1 TRINITY_DN13879_c0_g1~~TRINITY_DN13879_c0_g1_i9.p1  ORF type:complete len:157 (-),score=37.38 TRINITY_DN13879_c0_g1_i9:135-542(-)